MPWLVSSIELDGVGRLRLVEARPATSRLVLGRRVEQLGAARRAVIRAVGVFVDVLATPRPLGARSAQAPRTAQASVLRASRRRFVRSRACPQIMRRSMAYRSPGDLVAAVVIVRFDLQRGVGDAVPVGEQMSSLVEHGMRVGADRDHQVRGRNIHLGRQRPHVDVVHVDDAGDRCRVRRAAPGCRVVPAPPAPARAAPRDRGATLEEG